VNHVKPTVGKFEKLTTALENSLKGPAVGINSPAAYSFFILRPSC